MDVPSLRLAGPLHEAFMGAGLPDADRAVLLVTLLRRYGPDYSGGADALLTRFGADDEAKRFARVEADAFDGAAYHELSVRPLAYALLQGDAPDALVPVMTALSERETAASGSWSALTRTGDAEADVEAVVDALELDSRELAEHLPPFYAMLIP